MRCRIVCQVLLSMALWRAVLVLFVTADDRPMMMMIGKFPQVYKTRSQCMEFVAEKGDEIKAHIGRVAKKEPSILGSHVACMEDGAGSEA